MAESVDSTERPYLWGLEGSSVALRFATSCAFVLLLVWAAWSMVPSVHRRSPVWLQVVAGVGALVLLVVAWRLVPDAGVAFD